MTKPIILTYILSVLISSFCMHFAYAQEEIKVSEHLTITKLSEHSYIHTSMITLANGQKFGCNGFVYKNKNEAYIFDSPANEKALIDLIQWLQNDQKTKVKGAIFSHFHRDAALGMELYAKHHIPTMSSAKTAALLGKENKPLPNQTFKDSITLQLGNKKIISSFFGEAHTIDNIVSYFPEEELIFGGCMIKCMEASKGNLADANTRAWSHSVHNIKQAYPNLKTVIPGHGDYGDAQLLDYTITLFEIKK